MFPKGETKAKPRSVFPKGETKAKARSVFPKGETEKQNLGVCSQKGRQKQNVKDQSSGARVGSVRLVRVKFTSKIQNSK